MIDREVELYRQSYCNEDPNYEYKIWGKHEF